MKMVSIDCEPLAGSGLNTIRKFSSKYRDLKVGYVIEMNHQDGEGNVFAVEQLTISSIAIVSWSEMDRAWFHNSHGEKNHGRGLYYRDGFEEFYGKQEDDDQFIVIYFA